MHPTLLLFLLSTTTFIGSFLAGNIPLMFQLSEDKMHMTTLFGAGLIVGTALVVILPEGVGQLYDSLENESDLESHKDDPPSTTPENNDDHSHHSSDSPEAHSYIGPSLISGFIIMFLIDQIQNKALQPRQPQYTISVADVSEIRPTPPKIKKSSVTLGLIVHSAADGIALGASTASQSDSLGLIVFLAIMLHKAPSAFGLATFLLHEGFSRRRVRQHLFGFSLSAPIAAFLTYLVLAGGSLDDKSMKYWTGIVLLFSAGSFLFVATVHILPEVLSNGGNEHSKRRGSVGVGNESPRHEWLELNHPRSPSPGHHHHHHSGNGMSVTEMVILIGGMLFPMLLNMNHGH
ncbi:ZIP zinc transporter-domain-containing protein [Paraphysoderma sedebokerense]|nr:ZIP zinc transporter-domain-containing protein [Paraphysoderma sedebokerense]